MISRPKTRLSLKVISSFQARGYSDDGSSAAVILPPYHGEGVRDPHRRHHRVLRRDVVRDGETRY